MFCTGVSVWTFPEEDNASSNSEDCQAICSVLVVWAAWLPPHVWCELFSIYCCAIQCKFLLTANQPTPVALPLFWMPYYDTDIFKGKFRSQRTSLKEDFCLLKEDKNCPSTSTYSDFKNCIIMQIGIQCYELFLPFFCSGRDACNRCLRLGMGILGKWCTPIPDLLKTCLILLLVTPIISN